MADSTTGRTTRLPQWNKHPFTCPNCHRHFAPGTIRLMRHSGAWLCHRCQIEAVNGRQPPADPSLCATCHTPLGATRTVINVHGYQVHHHCPRKRRRRP